MSRTPVVVKLGGDALASPERIAAQARRLAQLAAAEPVIAVASARRGVTDHLLGLTAQVRQAAAPSGLRPNAPARAEADRVVATGEVVTAALLALALNELGLEAVSLDAREAGIISGGRFGSARIHAIAAGRIARLLGRGIIPVVTGFQGWKRGRVATLGRGGTDTSAVAIAVALRASRALFVKDAEGLMTADPKLVPSARPITTATHAFLSALTAAGARVVHADAARLAERHGLALAFHSLAGEAPATSISRDVRAEGLRAVATQLLEGERVQVTAVAGEAGAAATETDRLREALVGGGIPILEIQPAANGPRFLLAATHGVEATRLLHDIFVVRQDDASAPALRAS